MKALSDRETEFVAIGAAIASNCIPCVIYHVNEAKRIGITEEQIREAIDLVVGIRRTPADQVVDAANAQLDETPAEPDGQADGECSSRCC